MSGAPQPPSRRHVFISDFDGTITARDFYLVALDELTGPAAEQAWREYQAGRRTLFEALCGIFAAINVGEARVLERLPAVGFEAGVADAIRRLHAADWDVIIVSAGCRWYLDRLLSANGVDGAAMTIYANPGTFTPNGGLQMTMPEEARYRDPETGTSKAGVVRDALERYDRVAYAGDSMPDLPAIQMVDSARRFARSVLADALEDRGVPFRRFTRWRLIADVLLGERG
jgi:2-hydroxy-3-keto-5-methylthiopentenyl-1-phosphate phosphatase